MLCAGTFIALYAVLNSLKYVGSTIQGIEIVDIIRRMRRCRPAMVPAFLSLSPSLYLSLDLYLNLSISPHQSHVQPTLIHWSYIIKVSSYAQFKFLFDTSHHAALEYLGAALDTSHDECQQTVSDPTRCWSQFNTAHFIPAFTTNNKNLLSI